MWHGLLATRHIDTLITVSYIFIGLKIESATHAERCYECTSHLLAVYWATVCKTVRPMLSDGCLSCPSVCDVGVLRPNGWMDHDETWHAGRPRPWPHCVRWRSSSPPKKGAEPPPIFGPCRLWPNCRPSQLLLSTCFVIRIHERF